jgi:hypothetical protein
MMLLSFLHSTWPLLASLGLAIRSNVLTPACLLHSRRYVSSPGASGDDSPHFVYEDDVYEEPVDEEQPHEAAPVDERGRPRASSYVVPGDIPHRTSVRHAVAAPQGGQSESLPAYTVQDAYNVSYELPAAEHGSGGVERGSGGVGGGSGGVGGGSGGAGRGEGGAPLNAATGGRRPSNLPSRRLQESVATDRVSPSSDSDEHTYVNVSGTS